MLLAALIAGIGNVEAYAKRHTPDGALFEITAEGDVSFADLQFASTQLEGSFLHGEAVSQSILSAADGARRAPCDVVATDEHYIGVHHLLLTHGNFFYTEAGQYDANVCVISDELAVQLFLTDNAAGYSVEIGGKYHEIVGVYRTDRSWLYGVSAKNPAPVLLPFSSPAVSFPKVQEVYLYDPIGTAAADAYKTDAVITAALNGSIRRSAKQPADALLGIVNTRNVFVLIALLATGLLAARFLYHCVMALWRQYRSIGRGEARQHKKELLRGGSIAAAGGLALILCAVAITWLPVNFDFLPRSASLFNFGYYADELGVIFRAHLNARSAADNILFYCWVAVLALGTLADILFVALAAGVANKARRAASAARPIE